MLPFPIAHTVTRSVWLAFAWFCDQVAQLALSFPFRAWGEENGDRVHISKLNSPVERETCAACRLAIEARHKFSSFAKDLAVRSHQCPWPASWLNYCAIDLAMGHSQSLALIRALIND